MFSRGVREQYVEEHDWLPWGICSRCGQARVATATSRCRPIFPLTRTLDWMALCVAVGAAAWILILTVRAFVG